MSERLAGQPTRANFRTGTLTVCTMVPMRSVPHRVVCLLGLDDGVYPRASAVDGDNVLARRPLTGERDLRSEDRQLMLDAIMATQEHLVVTYSGANETNGQPRPPAVPLGELLDALDDTVTGGRAHALRAATPGHAIPMDEKDGHPLQAFDPCNFSVARAVLLRPGVTGRCPRRPARPRAGALAGRHDPAGPPGRRPRARLAGAPSSGTRSGPSCATGSGWRCPTRATRSPTGCRSSSTTSSSGAWATGCCVTCCGGALRTRRSAPSGGAAYSLPGTARLATRQVADQGRRPRGRDGRVGHPGPGRARGGRRRRPRCGPAAPGHRQRRARPPRGERDLLPARSPAVARGLDPAARALRHAPRTPVVGGCRRTRREGPPRIAGRPRLPGSPSPASRAPPTCCSDLVTMYDAGMCAPLPLPLRTGHAWAARRRPGNNNEFASRKDAEFKWLSNRFPGENDDAPARRGVGSGRPARRAPGCAAPRRGVRRRDHPPRRPRHASLATDDRAEALVPRVGSPPPACAPQARTSLRCRHSKERCYDVRSSALRCTHLEHACWPSTPDSRH